MAQEPRQIDWELLTRYITGELSAPESAAVERWFAADARHREELERLRDVWVASHGDVTGWDADRALANLRNRAEPAAARRVSSAFHSPSRGLALVTGRSWRSWWPVAATIVAVVAGGVPLPDRPYPR